MDTASTRFGSAPFHAALRDGCKELDEALDSGQYLLLPVPALWSWGVNNPELDDLPADIFTKWPISETGKPGARTDAFAGTWSGTVTEDVEGGGTVTYP